MLSCDNSDPSFLTLLIFTEDPNLSWSLWWITPPPFHISLSLYLSISPPELPIIKEKEASLEWGYVVQCSLCMDVILFLQTEFLNKSLPFVNNSHSVQFIYKFKSPRRAPIYSVWARMRAHSHVQQKTCRFIHTVMKKIKMGEIAKKIHTIYHPGHNNWENTKMFVMQSNDLLA